MPGKILRTQGISLCQEWLIKGGDVFTQKPNAFIAYLKFKYLYWTCDFWSHLSETQMYMCLPSIIVQWTESEIHLQSTGFLLATSMLGNQIPLLPVMRHSIHDGLNSSSATSRLCDLQQMCLEEQNETFEKVLVLPTLTLEATVPPSGREANEEQPRSPGKDARLYPQRTCWV